MCPPVVVIVDELFQSSAKHVAVICRTNINIFLFQRMPEPLYPNIIKSPVSPIHADGDFLFLQIFDPPGTGKLRSLVRVYDLWLAMFGDRFSKHLEAAFGIQRVGYIPTDNIATIDIHDGRQIKETLAHRDIRYVNAPDLIRMGEFQSSELVRPDVSGCSQFTQIALGINGHDAHLAKKSSYSFWANQYTKGLKEIHHPQNPFGGMLQILAIHLAHQFHIFRLILHRFIIYLVTVHSQKFTLAAYAQIRSRGNYFFEDFSIPSLSEALLQKSTSTSKRPIFSYRACSRLAASWSGAWVEKISAPRDKNSRFQFEIIWGCTSNRFDNSLSVSCSLMASIATCALKAALCFFLVVFIMGKINRFFLSLPSGFILRE